MRTSIAIGNAPWVCTCRQLLPSVPTGGAPGSFRHRAGRLPGRHDPDRLLGDLAVSDAERAELRLAGLTGRYQDIVRAWLTCVGDIRARRIRLGGRVGVVDDDRLLVPVVHFAPDPQLFHR